MHVTFEEAQQAIEAALKKAEETGTHVYCGGGFGGQFKSLCPDE